MYVGRYTAESSAIASDRPGERLSEDNRQGEGSDAGVLTGIVEWTDGMTVMDVNWTTDTVSGPI